MSNHAVRRWHCRIPVLFPDICCDLCERAQEIFSVKLTREISALLLEMNLVGGPGGKAPGSSWILGFLRLKSIMIMLYLNFKFIYYTQNWSKYCSMSFFFRSKFKFQNLYNPGASGGLCPPGPPTRATGGLQRSPDPSPNLFGTTYILESTSSL